jgi:uncharacterized protein
MLYLDTPALTKLVSGSADADRLRALLDDHPDAILFTSGLTHAELLRAAQPAGDEAVEAAREVLARVALVDVSRELLERAGTLAGGERLRTLDAIHVATASVAGDRLEGFVTYDPRLAGAAAAIGLPVVRP